MGYRGKLEERQRARELRAQAWTLQEIADELDVSKSSVSVWVRDVEFTPKPRKRGRRSRGTDHPLRQRKLAEMRQLLDEGRKRVGELSEREFLMAGIALYAGEGDKTDGSVGFANSDPRFIAFFCAWLRHFFEVDESRLRLALYLHEGLDIGSVNQYWSTVTGIPLDQFGKPYRAIADGGIRNTKHPYGCPRIMYHCSKTHRTIMGLVHGLLGAVEFRGALPDEFDPMHGI